MGNWVAPCGGTFQPVLAARLPSLRRVFNLTMLFQRNVLCRNEQRVVFHGKFTAILRSSIPVRVIAALSSPNARNLSFSSGTKNSSARGRNERASFAFHRLRSTFLVFRTLDFNRGKNSTRYERSESIFSAIKTRRFQLRENFNRTRSMVL